MPPWRAADHSPPSSAAVMEEYSYTSTHPLDHTGPVMGSLCLFFGLNKLLFSLTVFFSVAQTHSTAGEITFKILLNFFVQKLQNVFMYFREILGQS